VFTPGYSWSTSHGGVKHKSNNQPTQTTYIEDWRESGVERSKYVCVVLYRNI
jgi:hypothetical protein